MKRRTRRVLIGAAGIVAALLAILTIANWGTIRDHVEAWRFQATWETETVVPSPALMDSDTLTHLTTGGDSFTAVPLEGWLLALATQSGRTVVFDPAEKDLPVLGATGDSVPSVLEANGWRVIEQRFPRRAYVIIRDPNFKPKPTLLERRIEAWRASHPPPAAAPQ